MVDDLADKRDLVGFTAINVEDVGLFSILGLENLLNCQGQQATVARPLLGACGAQKVSDARSAENDQVLPTCMQLYADKIIGEDHCRTAAAMTA